MSKIDNGTGAFALGADQALASAALATEMGCDCENWFDAATCA